MPPHAPFNHPLTFAPLLKHRIWGGTRIGSSLGRPLPPNQPHIGESWEISDRPDDQSVVDHGPHAETSLNHLWRNHRLEVFGKKNVTNPSQRFPLLFKILDATDTLSVQVHPPESLCKKLQGESKTEAWHLLDATPKACVYAGFSQADLSPETFRHHLNEQTVASLLHQIPVQRGDTLFIPSGRCHAIGAGCLIAEIQQNSDTTYRLFDWNRTDPSGRPRDLHVDQALECIDFSDVTPDLHPRGTPLSTSCFNLDSQLLQSDARWGKPEDTFAILHVLTGHLIHHARTFPKGSTLLVPANLADDLRAGESDTRALCMTLPSE